MYATGGEGLPVLFLHGWGLDHRAYRRSLKPLTNRGCRVIAPAMPGFGGSNGLRLGRRSLQDYGQWVSDFLDALGIDEPILVLGHSLGGGVATRFAHDHPERVQYLILMNSVGATRPFGGTLTDHLGAISLFGPLARAMSPTSEGAAERMVHRVLIENLLRDPFAVANAGHLALTADLADEIAELAAREVPVMVLWSDNDSVIPRSAFDTFCDTFGAENEMVPGGHSWLLANPDAFGQVLDNVLHVQHQQHRQRTASSGRAELAKHLKSTTVPAKAIQDLLADASPMWVLSAPPPTLASDITLCHPRLQPDEVRAVARPTGPDTHRLTVVAHDRPGLLANTASILASEGIRVESASVMTWPKQNLALHALRVQSGDTLDEDRWAAIGDRLRNMAEGEKTRSPFTPAGRAHVTHTGAGFGTSVVRVNAPDRPGLLSAICEWFASNDVSVEAARVATVDGRAQDVFLIRGDCDSDRLADELSAQSDCPLRSLGKRITDQFLPKSLVAPHAAR